MAHGTTAEPKNFLDAFSGLISLVKTPIGTLVILVASLYANYEILTWKTSAAETQNQKLELRIQKLEENREAYQSKDDSRVERKEILDRLNQIYETVRNTDKRVDELYRAKH